MAKIEKIGNIQVADNKEDKFFYFPMISMACTGSGYHKESQVLNNQLLGFLCYKVIVPKLFHHPLNKNFSLNKYVVCFCRSIKSEYFWEEDRIKDSLLWKRVFGRR